MFGQRLNQLGFAACVDLVMASARFAWTVSILVTIPISGAAISQRNLISPDN
jgi:hypothetical protein